MNKFMIILVGKIGCGMKKLTMAELRRLGPEAYRKAEKAPLALVLDNVRSAYNVGAVFRTADAFRISVIHLCGITARPPHKDIYKTALGATETVEWHYFPTVAESLGKLHREGYAVFAVEQATPSTTLHDFVPPGGKKLALVFGHEVDGVSETALGFAEGCIQIPQYGTKHSLNIAVSAGIVIWEVFRKLPANFLSV
jgi:tRNA G18 (ribose-2'-O)-methylase SpoU